MSKVGIYLIGDLRTIQAEEATQVLIRNVLRLYGSPTAAWVETRAPFWTGDVDQTARDLDQQVRGAAHRQHLHGDIAARVLLRVQAALHGTDGLCC